MATDAQATIDDLYLVEGKAELVGGRLVTRSPSGFAPNRAAGAIYLHLRAVEKKIGGYAVTDNAGFIVKLPGRRSFSPDVAFYVGPRTGGKFLQGAPVFAVEVRSEGDYGPAAERKIDMKRAEYFAAGTKVVWDVDVLKVGIVRVYRRNSPDSPKVYVRNEIAEAEPAVPGWTFPVNDLFE